MTTATLPLLSEPTPGLAAGTWEPSPYLHVGEDRIYSPHTDRTIAEGEPGYDVLRRLVEREARGLALGPELRPLAEAGWLVESAA